MFGLWYEHFDVRVQDNNLRSVYTLYTISKLELVSIAGNSPARGKLKAAILEYDPCPEKTCFAYARTKAQISCAVTAQLISGFVFATYIR